MEIAIPFAQVEAINPNINIGNFEESLGSYFKCIVVCFATCRRVEPGATLVLYTNKPVAAEYSTSLVKLGVEIRIIEFNFNPPKIFGDRFRGCFFLFDAMRNIPESTLFIDPDIIAVDAFSQIQTMCGDKFGIFRLDFKKETFVNGIELETARSIYNRYLSNSKQYQLPEISGHLGGEIFFVPYSQSKEINLKISTLWAWNVNQAVNGTNFLTTEEHILNQLIEASESVELNSVISRIWTTKKFTTHQGNNDDINTLIFWHLPAEKSRGFIRMYNTLMENKFELSFDNQKFKNEVRKIMSIDKKLNLLLSQVYSSRMGAMVRKIKF